MCNPGRYTTARAPTPRPHRSRADRPRPRRVTTAGMKLPPATTGAASSDLVLPGRDPLRQVVRQRTEPARDHRVVLRVKRPVRHLLAVVAEQPGPAPHPQPARRLPAPDDRRALLACGYLDVVRPVDRRRPGVVGRVEQTGRLDGGTGRAAFR